MGLNVNGPTGKPVKNSLMLFEGTVSVYPSSLAGLETSH